jgi:hypothetical protein
VWALCKTTAVLRRRTLLERWEGIALALLLAACALALSACGGGNNATTQAQTETQTTTEREGTQAETKATETTGAANTVSPERYIASYCSSAKSALRQMETSTKEFRASLSTASSVADLRKSFVAYVDDAVVVTDRLTGSVRRAGTPDVEKGAQLAAGVRRSLREFRSLIVRLRLQVKKLPVDDAAVLNRRLQAIGASLQPQIAALAKTFDRPSTPELRRAVRNSPACRGLVR